MTPRILRVRSPAERRRLALPKGGGCALAIFGATGDLTSRKLLPALYRLERDGALDPCFAILGIGREEMDAEAWRGQMRAALETHVPGFDETVWRTFASRLDYFAADLTSAAAYAALATSLETLGAGDPRLANHLYYFAVPPSLAPAIVRGLAAEGLLAEGRGWTRLVLEKPFGRDLESARALNAELAKVVDEGQVFRIDHFLGKETVQNILAFRFGNTLFEPVWNRNSIDHVQITAAETLGVGERAGFYEGTGALRDMVANHLLQLLAVVAMEPPVAWEPGAVRDEKVKVLRAMPPIRPDEVPVRAVRGQFGPGVVDGVPVPGYREIEGVAPDSATETFAALEFRIESWRWAGVPFYVRTGKRLAADLTEIAIRFKRTPHSLFQRLDADVEPNVLAIHLKPDEAIHLTFAAKVPGEGMRTTGVRMEFDYADAFGVELPDAYGTLLLEAMEGDATLFTRGDEAEAQWKRVESVLEEWSAARPDFPNYAPGSEGPAAADEMTAANGDVWRPLEDGAESAATAAPAGGPAPGNAS